MDLAHWIERHAAFTPDKAAIRFEGRALTYAEMAAWIADLAGALGARGLGRGERIAFLGANSPDLLVLLFACARTGAILVPLNWRLAPPELGAILADAGPALLVVEPELRDLAEAACPDSRPVILDSGSLAEVGRGRGWGGAAAGASDPLLIVYTSGTTGAPKGAVLSQGAVLWNAINSAHMHDLSSADHVLTVLPLFHVGGLNIQTLPALHAGATVTLHRRFEPGATLAAIATGQPSLTVLVPATLSALIEHPAWPGTSLVSLRMVTTGAMIVPRAVIDPFQVRGVPVCQVYGTTETGPVAVYQRPEDAIRAPGSAGKPALHCDLRIVAEDGREVAPGEVGEVLIRGPNLMSGYWRQPEASAAALAQGWFRTGDIGRVDEQGDLWLEGRRDELIKSGGERVWPAEIEAVLRALPGVAEVAVVSRADPTWGEVPVAAVVRAPGATLGEREVHAALQGRLARFKHPKAVVFVDALPKNALGKVQRFRLRALLDRQLP